MFPNPQRGSLILLVMCLLAVPGTASHEPMATRHLTRRNRTNQAFGHKEHKKLEAIAALNAPIGARMIHAWTANPFCVLCG